MEGGFWMNCLRCGNEIPEGQLFCEGCREFMEKDPVPADAGQSEGFSLYR